MSIQSFIILNMLRTHAITVYCIAKVVNFPQSATTYLYWGLAAEPIAEKRHEGGVWPYRVSPCVSRMGIRRMASGLKETSGLPKGEAACLVSLIGTLTRSGELRSHRICLRLSCRIRRCRLQGRRACGLYRYPRFHRGCEPCRADER